MIQENDYITNNITVIDYLPTSAAISFSKFSQIVNQYFMPQISISPYIGSNCVVNAIFNYSTQIGAQNFDQSINACKIFDAYMLKIKYVVPLIFFYF